MQGVVKEQSWTLTLRQTLTCQRSIGVRCVVSDQLMVEEVCAERDITLVVHPAIRSALTGFEEEFSVAAAAFLQGEGRVAFFLPLHGGGDVKLVLSLRYSAGEHLILRVDPARGEGLGRIKEALRRAQSCK